MINYQKPAFITKMLRITKNYFLPKDAHLNDFETHFVLVTEQTKKLCAMAQLYSSVSELSGQLKEEEVINNFGGFNYIVKPILSISYAIGQIFVVVSGQILNQLSGHTAQP